MRSKRQSETGVPGRTMKKAMFIPATVFALLIPYCSAAPLCTFAAGSALSGGEMGQLTPLEPERRGPLPPVDKTVPPPAPLPPVPLVPESQGAINPRTGERYLPSGKGVINPRTGEYYPPSGRGYFNPRTGEYFPSVDQHRQ